MPSRFIAPAADRYDAMMGRWSRRLAPLLLDFAGLGAGEHIVDIGCGTGSLTCAALERARVARVDAVDFNAGFVEELARRNADSRVAVRQGDACALPYPDATFHRAYSLLVLHFVSDAARAVAEMHRVLRPGGWAAAAVWDTYGGMPSQRLFWDTIAAIEPSAAPRRAAAHGKPMTGQGQVRDAFERAGLLDVSEVMMTIRMDFTSFADYWQPQITGQSDTAQWFEALPATARAAIESAVRAAYLCERPDGPRSFATVAWAVKGRRG